MSFLITVLVSLANYPTVNEGKIKPRIIIDLLKNKKFIYLCIFALLSSGTMHSISGWIPTLFQKNLNLTQQISNYSLSIFWLSIVIGRTVTAFLSRKYKEILLLKVMNALMFLVLAFSFFPGSYVLILADYIVFGFLIGGTFPLIIAYSAEISPEYSSTRIATIFSFTAIGMFTVPTIVGMLAEYFPIYKVISFSAVSFLVYIYIFWRKLKD